MAHPHSAGWGSDDWHRLIINLPFHLAFSSFLFFGTDFLKIYFLIVYYFFHFDFVSFNLFIDLFLLLSFFYFLFFYSYLSYFPLFLLSVSHFLPGLFLSFSPLGVFFI